MPVTAVRTLTEATASSWIPLDIHSTPFNVGFGVVKSGAGTMTFKVEHTFDDIFDPDVTPDVFTHEDVSAATATIDGNYAFGIRACRLNVTAVSGVSTASLKVVQVGT